MTTSSRASAAEEWNVVRTEKRREGEKHLKKEKCNEVFYLLENLNKRHVCAALSKPFDVERKMNAKCIIAHILLPSLAFSLDTGIF